MMTFGQLPEEHLFTRLGSPNLVWVKNKPFTAYGMFKQNASTWQGHYDNISDDEIVIPTTWYEYNPFSDVPLYYSDVMSLVMLSRIPPKLERKEMLLVKLSEWCLENSKS